jgi:hypothetical protein
MKSTIVCALSGLTPTEEDQEILDEIDPQVSEDALSLNDLTDLPVGWMSIIVNYRAINAEHQDILLHKRAQIEQILANFPEEQRDDLEPSVSIQVDAQFAALEAQRKYRPTIVESQRLYIAPGDRAPGLMERIRNLFVGMGVELPDDGESPIESSTESPESEQPKLELVPTSSDPEDGGETTTRKWRRRRQ